MGVASKLHGSRLGSAGLYADRNDPARGVANYGAHTVNRLDLEDNKGMISIASCRCKGKHRYRIFEKRFRPVRPRLARGRWLSLVPSPAIDARARNGQRPGRAQQVIDAKTGVALPAPRV